jgi:DNA-binding IclR family transcriptional regulator
LSALGRAALIQDVGAFAMPSLERLAAATEDTVYASVREGVSAVCVGREIGAFPIRTLSLEVGDRRPLGVGSGSLALLAWLPDGEIEDIVERNRGWLGRYPGFTKSYVSTIVAETRRYGFSFVDERIIPGMRAIGVPVLGNDGRPLAALSLAAITARVSGDRVNELVALLKTEAQELAYILQASPAIE